MVKNAIKLLEVAKMLNLIGLDGKYIQAISNANKSAARDFKLTNVKKY